MPKLFRIINLMKKITYKKFKYKLRYFLAKMLSGYDIKYTTQYGIKLWLDLKKDVDLFLFLGDFESSNIQIFSTLINEKDTVIDVGANIGIYSILASKKVGELGRIYSFEPSTWARERLEKNIKLNNSKNINISSKGVSNKSGKIDFYICEDDAYNSIGEVPMRPVIKKEVIDVISLDDFCKEYKIEKVDILKVDTEGADYLVMQGAMTILNSVNSPVIFCEVNKNIKKGFNFTIDEYLAFFRNNGYSIYEIEKNTNKLFEFNLTNSNSSEIICLKEHHRKRYSNLLAFRE